MLRRGFRGELLDPDGQRAGGLPRPPHRPEGRRGGKNAFRRRDHRRSHQQPAGPQGPGVHPTVRHRRREDVNDNDTPAPITIKVTDGDKAYFVHFDRDSHELIDVFEYKRMYGPKMGQMSPRAKIIVDLAQSRIGMPLEATGETK